MLVFSELQYWNRLHPVVILGIETSRRKARRVVLQFAMSSITMQEMKLLLATTFRCLDHRNRQNQVVGPSAYDVMPCSIITIVHKTVIWSRNVRYTDVLRARYASAHVHTR